MANGQAKGPANDNTENVQRAPHNPQPAKAAQPDMPRSVEAVMKLGA